MHRARYLTLAAFAFTSGVGLTVSIALTTSNAAQLTYIVPAGHWVWLVSTVTGAGTTAVVSRAEETLN